MIREICRCGHPQLKHLLESPDGFGGVTYRGACRECGCRDYTPFLKLLRGGEPEESTSIQPPKDMLTVAGRR
jgi:hypothetical protein